MKNNTAVTITALAAAACALFTASSQAQSGILVSDTIATAAENPGIFNSTLSGTSVEDFSGMKAGVYQNVDWTGVGNISDLSLVNDNEYGGVPGTKTYSVESASASLGGQKNTTINLKQNSSYFGMYWSAGDAANTLSFYNGKTLVGSFSTASLMDKLPKGYDGNPNPLNLHQDPNEPFGFVNFSGLNGTSWNQIVLTDTASSGFESDDWTSRQQSWNPVTDGALPGTAISLVTTTKGVSTTDSITNLSTSGQNITIAAVNPSGKPLAPASFVPSAPGAPAPPMTACLAFAGVLVLQALRRRTA